MVCIKFTASAIRIPTALADAELVFEAGPLMGLCLKGFTVWQSKKTSDGLMVTFPSRNYTREGKTAYYWLLRGVNEDESKTMAFQNWILTAYQAWLASR